MPKSADTTGVREPLPLWQRFRLLFSVLWIVVATLNVAVLLVLGENGIGRVWQAFRRERD